MFHFLLFISSLVLTIIGIVVVVVVIVVPVVVLVVVLVVVVVVPSANITCKQVKNYYVTNKFDFSIDTNPWDRHTVWNCIFLFAISTTGYMSTHQMLIQRYMTIPSMKMAQM